MRKNAVTVITGAVLFVVLLFYWCFFTVRAGHVAVIKTLGAIARIEQQPGLYFKWFWPIQSVSLIDTRSRILHVPGIEILTKDKFNIIVPITIGWYVLSQDQDVRHFFNTLHGSVDNADEMLMNRVKSARKQVINKTQLHDIISTRDNQAEQFDHFESSMKDIIQKGLEEAGYGIAVDYVYVSAIKFPKNVTEKVFQRMVKERERISESYLARGQSEAKKIRDNAMTEKDLKIAEAEAQAIRIRGQADAEVADVYKVFQRNPELANWLRKIDALRKVLQKRTTIILPDKDPLGSLIDAPPLGKL